MREVEKETSGPGRPREFDEAEALSAIMNAFWKNGYEGTGLSDLVTATGVRKASLYKAFGNKHAMYLKALSHYDTLVVGAAVKALRNSERPAAQRIEAFLNAPIAAIATGKGRQGCFLCNAAADRADLDADTADMVASGYERMTKALVVAVGDLESAPAVAADAAALVMTVYSGLRIMARGAVPIEQLERAKNACLEAVL